MIICEQERKEIEEFFKRLKEGKISEKKKKKIYSLVEKLESKTELQKKRFYMYYKLLPNQKEEYSYKKIASLEDCSPTAIRTSVFKIIIYSFLNTQNSREFKNQLLKIIHSK